MLKKVRDSLGGRVRLLVVGSAPMAANVLTFMRAALGCTVSGTPRHVSCVSPGRGLCLSMYTSLSVL